ncbi:hypothetical protein TNCV_3561121 [Trichonephila clavipes]|nr:hypothetical protein TNCV_3561121 [Trichonephila clavipes]
MNTHRVEKLYQDKSTEAQNPSDSMIMCYYLTQAPLSTAKPFEILNDGQMTKSTSELASHILHSHYDNMRTFS